MLRCILFILKQYKSSIYYGAFLWLLTLSWLIQAQELNGQNELVIGELPDWVVPQQTNIDETLESLEPSNESKILLYDTQSNYLQNDPSLYVHSIIQVSNLARLSSQSTADVLYVPKYQSYSIINLNIIRGQDILDVRDKALVRFNQIEAPFGTDQFESPRHVMIFIPGLREGDIVDFSYMITGSQEAYKNQIEGSFNHGSYVSIGKISSRVLLPLGTKLNFFEINNPESPIKTQYEEYVEYVWSIENVEASDFEENAPLWHPTFPVTYYSKFSSWAEVRQWAEKLFISNNEEIEPKIVELAHELTDDLHQESDKIRAILTFMQKEIRYVGLELGRNNYQAFPALTVLERMFGDCKDQTELLLKLLGALDIQAFPVLTDSQQGRWMLTALPTPTVFNHVFVVVQSEEGDYWIDPTVPLFGESEAKLENVGYGFGLKLDGRSENLDRIPENNEQSAKYVISVVPGVTRLNNQARVFIEQNLNNDSASLFRNTRGLFGTEEHNEYLKAFAGILITGKDIEQIDELSILDSYKTDHLDASFSYLINEPWISNDSEDRRELWTYSQFVRQYLMGFESTENRIAPSVLNYPVDIEETFKVTLPDWGFEESYEKIESQYHVFEKEISYEDNHIRISYKYETLKDFIKVEDVSTFNDEIQEIAGKLNYYFYRSNNRFLLNLMGDDFEIEMPVIEMPVIDMPIIDMESLKQ